MRRWTFSRFNSTAAVGGERIVHNSYSGAIAVVTEDEYNRVKQLRSGTKEGMDPDELLRTWAELGFLVPAGTDERERAEKLHRSAQQALTTHLIVLPTEACNFRCTYCYESFARGEMEPGVAEGLKRWAEQNAGELQGLHVSWFGGEPLLAAKRIEELSDAFLLHADRFGFPYSADVTTNGYFLTPERFERLLERRVNRFMITLDGPADVHDRRRRLAGGGATHAVIWDNLQRIRETEADCSITLRLNFDRDNEASVEGYLDELSRAFGADPRFSLLVRPVGQWGGPHDADIPVCSGIPAEQSIWRFTERGIEKGLKMSPFIAESLAPGGSVCYAANPRSMVIGAEGRIYKCTLVLDDERNQVGRLLEDGRIEADKDKWLAWTSSGEETDEGCQACFFRPACQGNHCPLYRMRTGNRPCSFEKKSIRKVLELMAQEERSLRNA